MNILNLDSSALVQSEIERRSVRRNRHHDRPDSSLRVVVRSLARRRWEASHEGRPH